MSTASPTSAGIRKLVGSKSKRTKAPPPPPGTHQPPTGHVTSPVNGTSNHHASSGVNGIGDTNGITSKHEDNKRPITVALPDGRTVKATVDVTMPMLDLLVLISAKNKINPASYTIARVAHDLNGETVLLGPHKCVGDVDEEDIFKVVPKNTQEHFTLKRDKKKSAIFDQTIRLTVVTDKSHRFVVRINPSRPLLELFPVICKERGVEQTHHVLRLVAKPHEPLNMRESLNHYGVTELLLIDTRVQTETILSGIDPRVYASVEESSDSDPEGPPGMHEKKKKSGFFSRLSRKKKAGYELGGGGGSDSVIPTSTTDVSSSKPPPPHNNNMTVTTKPPSHDPHNTSNISRNARISKKNRPAPKPPGAKSAPFSPNEEKGIVSQMGSLKKRRAPPPPKVPDTITETPDSPSAVSSDGHFDTTSSTGSGDTAGIVTSTPMYHDNKSESSGASPGGHVESPPPPPPEFEESRLEEDAPRKPSRSFSLGSEGDGDEDEEGSEFEFPPPPTEVQLHSDQNSSDGNDEHTETDDASVEEEVVDEAETVEEEDISVEVEGNVEALPEVNAPADGAAARAPPPMGRRRCMYCQNPENGECECMPQYANGYQAQDDGDLEEADDARNEDGEEGEEDEENTAAQVTSPNPGSKMESTKTCLPTDQSHSMLDSDSVDISSGGGIFTQSDHSADTNSQSENSDAEDAIPTSHGKPVVLVGVKRLVSQSTTTEFSSDSEYGDTTDSTATPGSRYKVEDDSDVIVTEWTDDVEGASPHIGKTIQVSEEQVKTVADGYEEKRNVVFLATRGSGEVSVEGYNLYSANSNLKVMRSEETPLQGHAKLSKLALYADAQSKNETKAERQVALSRMMKLSFEVEDSNETTNCSPSPHPENDMNMLEEKSLHEIAYNVKRTSVSASIDEEEEGEVKMEEKMVEDGDNKIDNNNTKESQPQGEVRLSIEALREQYITLQQQMSLLQNQLSNQTPGTNNQQPMNIQQSMNIQQPMTVQPPMNMQMPANADLHMQQLHQQQLMMQQMMLQQMQQPQGIPMMMPPPGVIMVPVAPATSMQANDLPADDKKTIPHGETNGHKTSPKEKVKPDKKLPFKMPSQSGAQSKSKTLKYSDYLKSAKREFAKKQEQKQTDSEQEQKQTDNTNIPQAAIAPTVSMETEQKSQSYTDYVKSAGQRSKVNDAPVPDKTPVVAPVKHNTDYVKSAIQRSKVDNDPSPDTSPTAAAMASNVAVENDQSETVDNAPEHEEIEVPESEHSVAFEQEVKIDNIEHLENISPENGEAIAPEHALPSSDSDTHHPIVTSTSISASSSDTISSSASLSLPTSADAEIGGVAATTTTLTPALEGSNVLVEETDQTNKQQSIPQARVPPLVAAKPASRGPAHRISVKTARDEEVEKIGDIGNVTKFRQMFGGGDH